MDIKDYQKKINGKRTSNKYYGYLIKFLFTGILVLFSLILLKSNSNFKTFFYKNIYDTNFSFAKINSWYEGKFGSPIPFKNLFQDKVTPVFKENLKYKAKNIYKDGVELTVDSNYLVPNLKDGVVVFIGDKDEYKNVIIVEQSDGVSVWYSNVSKLSVKLYDNILKGDLLGETVNNKLYLVFKKDGKNLDYKDFI